MFYSPNSNHGLKGKTSKTKPGYQGYGNQGYGSVDPLNMDNDEFGAFAKQGQGYSNPAMALGSLKNMGGGMKKPSGGWQKVGKSWVTGQQAANLQNKPKVTGYGKTAPQGGPAKAPTFGDQMNAVGWADWQNASQANQQNWAANQQAANQAQATSKQAAGMAMASGDQVMDLFQDPKGPAGQLTSKAEQGYDDMEKYVANMNATVDQGQKDAYAEMQGAIDGYQDMTAQNLSGQAASMAQGLQQRIDQISMDPSLDPAMRQSMIAEARGQFQMQQQQALTPLTNQFNESLAQMKQAFAGMKFSGAGQLGQTMAAGGQLLNDQSRQRTAAYESAAGFMQAAASIRNASQMAAANMLMAGDQQAYENRLRNPFTPVSMLDTFLMLAGAQTSLKHSPMNAYNPAFFGAMK